MSDTVLENDNLTQKASKGAFWGLASNISVSAISFINTAILARILDPRDFGLIGMAVMVTGILYLFGNLYLGAALIQKREINNEYLSTAFWSSVFVSTILFFIVALFAPAIATFFNEPAVKWIIIFLASNLIISSLSSIQMMFLYKDIRLRDIALVEIVSRIARIFITLFCAVRGMGFWSIAIGMVAEKILKTVLFCFAVKWRPAFIFSKEKFQELFLFARNLYGKEFLEYFSRNADFIFIGKFLGAGMLGYYQLSYNLPYLVYSYVQDGINPVAFPVFSKVSHDRERLSRGLFNATKYVSMITFPLMAGLSFCANDFIIVVYSAKWLPAVLPLRLLCFSAALASINCLVSSIFYAAGKPGIVFKWALIRLPLTIVSVIFCSRWGIIGIAAAMFFIEFITVFLAFVAAKSLNTGFKRYLSNLIPAFSGSLAMVSGLYVFNHILFVGENVYLGLAMNCFMGAILYLLALITFFKRDLAGIIHFIKLTFIKPNTVIGKEY